MKRMKKVLYFEVVLDAAGARKSIRFLYDSDVLHWKKYNYEAQTHLMVHHYYTEQGVFVKSRVYNYSKVDITHKFNQPDPAKRILLFVNGYRPVSQGMNPDKALENIQKKGIEFPILKTFVTTMIASITGGLGAVLICVLLNESSRMKCITQMVIMQCLPRIIDPSSILCKRQPIIQGHAEGCIIASFTTIPKAKAKPFPNCRFNPTRKDLIFDGSMGESQGRIYCNY